MTQQAVASSTVTSHVYVLSVCATTPPLARRCAGVRSRRARVVTRRGRRARARACARACAPSPFC
eukprot:scaffold3782_cov301-Prasinococcus_capsulatus_cf.AAC.1